MTTENAEQPGVFDRVIEVPGVGPKRIGDLTGPDHQAIAEALGSGRVTTEDIYGRADER